MNGIRPDHTTLESFQKTDSKLNEVVKEVRKRLYFNKLNIDSNESSKISVISSVLEIICTMKNFIFI